MIYDSVIDGVSVSEVISKRNDILTPEDLLKLWMIPIDIAKNTIRATTFPSIRTNEGRISRRFRIDTHQRRYKRLGDSNARFYTDTLFSKVKGITGETYAQLYTNRVGFTKLYPLITESKAHESLTTFIHEVGIPHELHSDNAKALIQGDYRRKVKSMKHAPLRLNLILPDRTIQKGKTK